MPFDSSNSLHWLEATRRNINLAFHFTKGMDEQTFLNDTRTVYAVIRCLEIISEASRRIPETIKARHPTILWKEMAGAGNVYRHDYEDIAPHYIWVTLQKELSPLLAVIEYELQNK
jgi:uncharacterized protein with HEPN domain